MSAGCSPLTLHSKATAAEAIAWRLLMLTVGPGSLLFQAAYVKQAVAALWAVMQPSGRCYHFLPVLCSGW